MQNASANAHDHPRRGRDRGDLHRAAVGDFTRFGDADELVAYVGLNPKVRQSGTRPRATGALI